MKKSKKTILTLVSLAVLLFALVGTTLAYLTTSTDPVVNTFTPTKVPIEIVEEIDGDVKKDVQVKNTGNIDAYIRVAVVVTWKDDKGNVSATVPVEGTDYEMTWYTSGWTEIENYYYYNSTVSPNNSTENLFTDCKVKDSANKPDGYNLSVEILAQSIQAVPEQAVKDAWGVKISNNTVEAVTKSN